MGDGLFNGIKLTVDPDLGPGVIWLVDTSTGLPEAICIAPAPPEPTQQEDG